VQCELAFIFSCGSAKQKFHQVCTVVSFLALHLTGSGIFFGRQKELRIFQPLRTFYGAKDQVFEKSAA